MRPFYRPELDALRFAAFLAVFITHTVPSDPAIYLQHHVPSLLPIAVGRAGAFGVSLFFTLSSYLITSLLLREKEGTGTLRLSSFYYRRILRIWPLYFFLLALAAFWPMSAWRLPPSYLWAYLLLAGNWATVFWGPPHSFASILWSVSIEEQFYLSWPVVVKRLSGSGVLKAALTLIVLANLARVWLSTRPLTLSTVFPNTFAQLDTIALGAILAVVGIPRLAGVLRILLAAASLGALIVCGNFYGPTPGFTVFGYPLIALACAGLLIAVSGLTVPASSYVVRLGKISYGLYAYHTMSLMFVGLAIRHANTALRFSAYCLGGLALTVLLAEASYRWMESPFLRLKERFTIVASRPV